MTLKQKTELAAQIKRSMTLTSKKLAEGMLLPNPVEPGNGAVEVEEVEYCAICYTNELARDSDGTVELICEHRFCSDCFVQSCR
mmetsp:Transcript_21146/g.26061  ORF Transcript_21146/g.26061 Transcript_21146/m.26061 type:complete len:84 (-) Transcript_21146:1056-1307(-)